MCAAVDESTNFDYNWDEISVGDFIVNNSVNFFGKFRVQIRRCNFEIETLY